MKFTIAVPPYALKIVETLEAAGFEAWFVGGCVRDTLLGASPADWDVATSALPEETLSCFRNFTTVATGLQHGTVTVISEGKPIEVTTYRTDGDYTDARHPDAVAFTPSIEEDLARRDFTVNALAYHPERGILDCFGGEDDLSQKLLRCVGEAPRRFREDALRILRCLRFSSVLGFDIEEKTRSAALKSRKLLEKISHERVREELTKLLCGENAAQVLRENREIIFTVLPELSPMPCCTQEHPYHCFDVWEHSLHALEATEPDAALRWAALLHDCGKPQVKTIDDKGIAHFYGHANESVKLAQEILDRLRFSNREREAILELIKLHGEVLPISEKRLKKLLGKLGEEQVFRLFQLIEGDVSAQAPHLKAPRVKMLEEGRALALDILARGDCLTLKDLAVHGEDLLAIGYPKGKPLGDALNTLLDEVTSGALENDREALIARAKTLLKK